MSKKLTSVYDVMCTLCVFTALLFWVTNTQRFILVGSFRKFKTVDKFNVLIEILSFNCFFFFLFDYFNFDI